MAVDPSLSDEQSPSQSVRASPSRSSPAKQDAEAASETSSVSDPSDRRDADILTQVLSTRSEEYRLLFRLPADEVLVQDFNCAFQENILLQGHMYLFVHHVCFYSNIFGFETKKTIPFHEVSCVRKAKTAGIFPNAIDIVAGGKKYFFGSFLSRDEAYRLIIDGWAQHSSGDKTFLDCAELKTDATTQDNALVTLESSRESNHSSDFSPSLDRNKDSNILEECKPLLNGSNDIGIAEKLPEVTENGEGSLFRGEPLNWQPEDVDAPKIPGHFTIVGEAKFPVNVEVFFNLFISDSSFEFLHDFHRRCGDKDFHCTPWRKHVQFGHARDVSFSHPVNIYIGERFGQCNEVQKFRVYRNSHLVIETAQQISDVPYGDYFQVEGIWEVVCNNDEDNGCILRVYSNVTFSKRTMFKGKIEQSTRDECREVCANWIKFAHELLRQKKTAQLEGSVCNNTRLIQDKCVESEGYLKLEGTSETLHQGITPNITEIVPDTKNFSEQIDNPMQEMLKYFLSLASTLKASWDALVSYIRSQKHFSASLVVAFAVVIILTQISIILLLSKAPKVHVITHENFVGSPVSSSENIEWLEKRFNYLHEEMFILENRMERMRHEYSLLKAHLQNLERLYPKS